MYVWIFDMFEDCVELIVIVAFILKLMLTCEMISLTPWHIFPDFNIFFCKSAAFRENSRDPFAGEWNRSPEEINKKKIVHLMDYIIKVQQNLSELTSSKNIPYSPSIQIVFKGKF